MSCAFRSLSCTCDLPHHGAQTDTPQTLLTVRTTRYYCSMQGRQKDTKKNTHGAKQSVDFFFLLFLFFFSFFQPWAGGPATLDEQITTSQARRMNCADVSRRKIAVSVAGVAAFCAGRRGMFSHHCERGRERWRDGAGKKKRQKLLLEKKKKKKQKRGNFLECRIAAGLSRNPFSSKIGEKNEKKIALALWKGADAKPEFLKR